jgi:hypothetical protein
MRISTTVFLLLLTIGLGTWLVLRGNSSSGDLNGHLLFDWSDRLASKGEVGVDVDPAKVAGIDLKISSGEFSLRRPAGGAWEISGGVKDRADEEIVKELLNYCTKAQIKDIVSASELKEAKTSAASLGLDDANAWRVTWLNAEGGKLAEVKIGKTAPLDNVSYVQIIGQEDRRPDVYIVSPDLRPLLARPPDSFRDPRISRYPAEVLVKAIVRKGEGEVEFSRTFQQAKTVPGKGPPQTESTVGKNVIEVEGTPWVISRPLSNAPADQPAVNDFVTMICTAKAEAWLPFSETENAGEKPIVEVILVPAGNNTKGVTLSFLKDPADTEPAAPDANTPAKKRFAICRDTQRKASFKVDRQLVEDLSIAESPRNFRSRVLASVDPAIVSTFKIEQTAGVSVEVVRVRDKWYWRPLKGGKFEDAAPEAVERLIARLNTTEIIDFPSDSLSDPKTFGLDNPLISITIAAGAHISLDQLTPVDDRNSQTLRIGMTSLGSGGQLVVPETQEKIKGARFYANFTRDPFVFQIGPELPGDIPQSFFKWRSLALPGFSVQQVRIIRQTIGANPPLELRYEPRTFKWTAKRGDTDVTSRLIPGAVESFAMKAGSLQAVAWQDSGPGAAQTALELPAVRIEVEYEVFDDKPSITRLATSELVFAPMSVPTAPYCFGRLTGVAEPFLIQHGVMTELSAPLVQK